MLHEACHLIVLPPSGAPGGTDATDSVAEEDATCYLQIVLADALPGGPPAADGRHGCLGYTFRLGSTRAWFEHDAEDAKAWLRRGRSAQPIEARPRTSRRWRMGRPGNARPCAPAASEASSASR
jgi:hypothetical protein